MDSEEHSWIEVRRLDFLEELRQLAKFRIPKKQKQKLVLVLDGDEMVLTVGVYSSRVAASGQWFTPAVFPYQILDAFIGLVEVSGPEETVRLKRWGNCVLLGSAKLFEVDPDVWTVA